MNDAIHGLYIRQNIATKGSMDNENGTFSNILARIQITTNAGGVIFHKPNEATHHNLVGTNAIDNIGVKLTDDRNRAIDLNGLDWQVALLISFVENFSLDTIMKEKLPLESQTGKILKDKENNSKISLFVG